MTEDSTTDQIKKTEFDSRNWFGNLPPSQKVIAVIGALSVLASPEVQKKVREADEDDLTHTPNRRRFREAYEEIIKKHPNPNDLAIAIIDLDKLKELNDTHGHHAGNEYLQFFADFLKKHTRRESDILARGRIGGDEFCALFDLKRRAEEEISVTPEVRTISYKAWLKDDFEREVRSNPSLKTAAGFSIGFAVYKKGKTFEELMKEADSEMYRDKMSRGIERD